MKIALLLLLSFAWGAEYYLVSTAPAGYRGEKSLGDYYLLGVFSSADKALYVMEDAHRRCDCPVFLYRGKPAGLKKWLKERTLACLQEGLEHAVYPEGFNRELFLQDVRKRIGKAKIYFEEEKQCRKKKDLKEFIPLLRLSGIEDIAWEVEKFYRDRGK